MRPREHREPAHHQIVKNTAPGIGGFAAHVLDREKHRPAARTAISSCRHSAGAPVDCHPYGRAVRGPGCRPGSAAQWLVGQQTRVPGIPINFFDLAPHPAHDVLAHGATEQRRKSTPHPARVGAREIGARDQRIGCERAALISSQRLAVPFGGVAIGRLQPSPRHGDLGLAEAAGQRARAAAMPVAYDACRSAVSVLCTPVARTRYARITLRWNSNLTPSNLPDHTSSIRATGVRFATLP
jgi:hypothetical protein